MKAPLNKLQLFILSLFAFSAQFIVAIQIAYTSSLFTFLGVDSSKLSYLWLLGPIAGLLIQPLIGELCDSMEGRLDRHILYSIICGILTSVAIFLMPLSPSVIIATILLWISFCGINGCIVILRVIIGNITPFDELARVYSLQTIFTGFAVCLAGVIPWVLDKIFIQPSVLSTKYVPLSLKIVFAIGAVILLMGLLLIKQIKAKEPITINSKPPLLNITHIINSIKNICLIMMKPPTIIKEFIIMQFFTWIGIFCMWVYFPISLAQHVYGLSHEVNILHQQNHQLLLTEGTILAGVCYSFYQVISMIYALLLSKILTNSSKMKLIYGFSLLAGGIGLFATTLTKNLIYLMIDMIGVGIMLGGITVIPPIIITKAAPLNKMGKYHGIFNITVTVPQIIAGVMLGPINRYVFHNNVTHTILLASLFIIISAIITWVQIFLFTTHKTSV